MTAYLFVPQRDDRIPLFVICKKRNKMKKLNQKRFWVKREYTLHDTHVESKYKDLRKTNETEIHYKNIKGGRERLLEGDFAMYVVFRICWVITVLTIIGVEFFSWINYRQSIIFFVIGILALGLYYPSRKDYIKIGLTNEQSLYFFKDKPNQEIVSEFIDEMLENRNQYLRSNYLNFDKLLSYEDQRQNLKLLFEYKVIDQAEFDNQKLKLRQMFNNEDNQQNQIGFI